ncbi:nucleoside-diphosphate-sugar epimerase [Salinibacterium sp. CAN_S4]|uniref:NAD-dependent epimerase/dehydratase family protein n=1 Tax=Salinibacterium sp. CAN_S4 TaxID=2787727 RepID=UPI0018F00D8E
MTKEHVVVGAGALGRAVAAELVGRGHTVRIVSRAARVSVTGAEHVQADAVIPGELDSAFRGAAVVYQCAQPSYTRWAQEFPQLQAAILGAAARAGADLVIADNLYMYGDPHGKPINESTPELPHTKKGRVRKAMADAALEAHRSGRLRVALSRPSDYFGPGHDQSSKSLVENALRGKPMQLFGRLDQPHSFSFVPDAAACMATLGTSEQSWGRAWIAPVQPPITLGEFTERVWSVAGRTGAPRISLLGRRAVTAIGFVVPVVREIAEMLYEWERPFVVDSSLFQRTFSVAPTSLDTAIERTVDHYRAGVTSARLTASSGFASS